MIIINMNMTSRILKVKIKTKYFWHIVWKYEVGISFYLVLYHGPAIKLQCKYPQIYMYKINNFESSLSQWISNFLHKLIYILKFICYLNAPVNNSTIQFHVVIQYTAKPTVQLWSHCLLLTIVNSLTVTQSWFSSLVKYERGLL